MMHPDGGSDEEIGSTSSYKFRGSHCQLCYLTTVVSMDAPTPRDMERRLENGILASGCAMARVEAMAEAGAGP